MLAGLEVEILGAMPIAVPRNDKAKLHLGKRNEISPVTGLTRGESRGDALFVYFVQSKALLLLDWVCEDEV
jgi:hypothetical protein